MQVTIYTTPTCGFCHQAKAYLRQRGIPFVEKDVSADPAAAAEMVRLSGQRGVPVIVVDGEVVVGFNAPRLEALLTKAQGASRPRLGAAVADAASIARKEGRPPLTGAYVGRVHAGSPAERAGLRPRDIVVECNGWPIRDADELLRVLAGLPQSRPVPLVVLRDGERLRLELVL